MSKQLEIFLAEKNAIAPTKGSTYSACYDLYATCDVFLEPGKVTMIDTGIKMNIPDGYEVQIRNRSGNASKGILLANGIGTIDSDYTGGIRILLLNTTDKQIHIKYKEKAIAQFLLSKLEAYELVYVNECKTTERGDGGFGSTDSRQSTKMDVK